MNKLIASLLLTGILITGCSAEEEKKEEPNKAAEVDSEKKEEPKTEEKEGAAVEKPAAETAAEEVTADAKGTVEENGWIKYRGAEWSGDFNGLNMKINSVSVTNDLVKEQEGQEKAVSVWMTLENKSDHVLSAYVTAATLVTSTGEQLDVTDHNFEDFIGDVYEGVTVEGDIWFVLKNTEDVADIEWIKLVWSVGDLKGKDIRQEEIKIDLK